VRSYSPVHTLGGGIVLDALPPRRTTLRPHERELLEALLAHDLSSAVTGLLAARALPLTSTEVAAALGVTRGGAASELNHATLERLKAGSETYFVAPDALDALVAAIERELLALHAASPTATGVSTVALRDVVDRRIESRVFDAVLAAAHARGVAAVDAGLARHPAAAAGALGAQADAEVALLGLVERQGLAPASVRELADEGGVELGVARKALGKLVTDGLVVRIGSELHFSAGAIRRARELTSELLSAHSEGATAAQLRDALGVSRKYAIPLLEYFDAQGFTKRVGDARVLRSR